MQISVCVEACDRCGAPLVLKEPMRLNFVIPEARYDSHHLVLCPTCANSFGTWLYATDRASSDAILACAKTAVAEQISHASGMQEGCAGRFNAYIEKLQAKEKRP